MAIITLQNTAGRYFNSSGDSSDANQYYYYSDNRAVRMSFGNIANIINESKEYVFVKSAILKVKIYKAGSAATFTFGYNYSNDYVNRKALLSKKENTTFPSSTGNFSIDMTDVFKDYFRDGQTGTPTIWGYGTGTNTTDKRFYGYDSGQNKPTLTIEYDVCKNVRIYTGEQWKTAIPYVFTSDGTWKPVNIKIKDDNEWK